MAALTLGLALTLPPALSRPARAGDPPPTGTEKPEGPGAGSKLHTVKLELAIAGLRNGGPGCDVEIKPGHAGCKFRPITQHVSPGGYATIVVKDVQTRNADRDCTFAITIREPGQAERTVHRGLRLKPPGAPSQVLTCYLSSPSRIARNGSTMGTSKR
jgi:hypothetical protein